MDRVGRGWGMGYHEGPPGLETLGHWPSWLNARGHVDRSACVELRVSEVRRMAGCVPMVRTKRGKVIRAKGRAKHGVEDLPNARRAVNGKGRLLSGWLDVYPADLEAVMRGRLPRALSGDWRTGRAPAMRRSPGSEAEACGLAAGGLRGGSGGMGLEQGGYGPGSFAYERGLAAGSVLDAGLSGNPNRGASREKALGLPADWVQRVGVEQWRHGSVSGVQYFLVCPGCGRVDGSGDGWPAEGRRLSTVGPAGLKGLTGTASNAGDGSRGAHGGGWVCGERVYKLFLVLARPEELRDAALAARWIDGLSSAALARQSSAVSGLLDRYGAVMGGRKLRCRRCLRLRYGQSPDVLRNKRLLKVERKPV